LGLAAARDDRSGGCSNRNSQDVQTFSHITITTGMLTLRFFRRPNVLLTAEQYQITEGCKASG